MTEERFDLHIHSDFSDGTYAPREVVRLAGEAGLVLMALTDHDGMGGVPEARAAAEEYGVRLLPGVEMDTEHTEELHILGLDVDPDDPVLTAAIRVATERRNTRNERIFDNLAAIGCDVRPWMKKTAGTVTRMHIAVALREGGFAKDVGDAFARYLRSGRPGYADAPRYTPEEAIALIRGAGGVAVIAHPCHLKGEPALLVKRLKDAGLEGIEAYYPTSTKGQTALFLSLAAQYGLRVTAGSDFHGANRPRATLGCAWRPVPALTETLRFFTERHQS